MHINVAKLTRKIFPPVQVHSAFIYCIRDNSHCRYDFSRDRTPTEQLFCWMPYKTCNDFSMAGVPPSKNSQFYRYLLSQLRFSFPFPGIPMYSNYMGREIKGHGGTALGFDRHPIKPFDWPRKQATVIYIYIYSLSFLSR